MRTAIKIVSRAASLIQPIALRLRPLRARWDKYWDVDHRSVNFYSNDEAAAALEKQREKWNEAEKQRILQYSRVHIIPRLRFDILADKPNIGIEKRKRQYMRGNLLQNNPVAFHLLHGGVAALYLACVIGVLLWYHSVMPEPTFDAKSSNKVLMSKRLAIIEHELGIDAERKSRPPPAITQSTTASRGLREEQWRSANTDELKRLEAELSNRQKDGRTILAAVVGGTAATADSTLTPNGAHTKAGEMLDGELQSDGQEIAASSKPARSEPELLQSLHDLAARLSAVEAAVLVLPMQRTGESCDSEAPPRAASADGVSTCDVGDRSVAEYPTLAPVASQSASDAAVVC